MPHIEPHEDGFRVVVPHKRDLILEFKDRLLPSPDLSSPVGESAWLVGDSPAECQDLMTLAKNHDLTWSRGAMQRVEERLGEDPVTANVDKVDGELWPHQRKAVEHLLTQRKTLLADDRSLGKSLSALAALEAGGLFPSVVVTTSSATHNWVNEVDKWIPHRGARIVGSRSESLPDTDIAVMSWDLLSYHVDDIRRNDMMCIVADEAHKARNITRSRSKALRSTSTTVPYAWGLTGTPIVNYVKDSLNTLYALNALEDRLGDRWTTLKRYTDAKRERIGWDPRRNEPKYAWDTTGSSHLDDLCKRLNNTGAMLRRLKRDTDNLNLPDKRVEHQFFRLDKDMRGRYEEAERAHKNDPNGNSLSRLNHLRQIAANGKLPAAFEWIRGRIDQGEQVVTFSYHDFVLDALLDEFNEGALHVRGGDKPSKRQERIEAFQNGHAPLMACNVKAAGEAINLNAAHECLFLEIWWNAATVNQALDRLHRPGVKEDVVGWFFIAKDTVDEVMWEHIERKNFTSSKVLGDPAGEREALMSEVEKEVL